MSLVRSTVFIAVGLAAQTAVCPTGKRWLVKYVLISNPTGSSSTYSIQVKIGAGSYRQLFAGTLPNGITYVLAQPFMMDAGDTLQVSGGSGSLVVAASGIEFTP